MTAPEGVDVGGERAEIAPDPERPDRKVVRFPGAAETPRREPGLAEQHFRVLGHYRGTLYVWTKRGRQMLALPGAALAAKSTLLQLAPLMWWEREFPSQSGFKGAAVDQAIDELWTRAYERGVFRPEQVRGRGAWWDEGRLVVHAGNRLIVDGEERPLEALDGRFVYEAQPPIPIALDDPLSAAEATQFFRWATALTWEKGRLGATLFAGWVVVAMVGGALAWRPHIFLTGPSGCGKTTALKVALSLMGEWALSVKGDTSAAGVRQALGPDALPVLFDEAEAENQAAEDNLNRMLALMRAASADSESRVLKGGQGGEATGYAVRSMFCLTAIRVGLKQTADHTRITVLEMRPPQDREAREEYARSIAPLARAIGDPRWAARFRARVLLRVGELRANAETFGEAAAYRLGSARLGDQLGPLLAGAYLLHRDGLVSQQAASEWVERQQWDEQAAIAQERDEERLLAVLLETRATIQVDRARYDLSVGELAGIASARAFHRNITARDALAELGRRGMLASATHLYVSNTHREIGAALRGTSWAAGWERVLRRLDGARACDRKWYGGAQSRGTAIPLAAALPAADAPAPMAEAWDGPPY